MVVAEGGVVMPKVKKSTNPFMTPEKKRKFAAAVYAHGGTDGQSHRGQLPGFVKRRAKAGKFAAVDDTISGPCGGDGPTVTAAKVRMPEPESLVIVLDPGVAEVLKALSNKRGVDVQTLIRVSLRNLAQRTNYYDLGTSLSFGKYRGETMETVIRCDPQYVVWAQKTFDGLELSDSCLDLLTEMAA